jgi:N6-adenosine-specific RNA methylase IME4
MILPFEQLSFHTVYADPPWPEKGAGVKGGRRGADRHYSLMSVQDIANLASEVIRITKPEAHCYLWVTNNYLPSGLRVLKDWGFDYRTTITWAKDRFGLGQYFRGQTEHCLFGVRGALPYRIRGDGHRSQGTTLIQAKRQGHSEKPDEMRQMIELVSHPPYVELFARVRAAGWDAWGDGIVTGALL